MLLFFDFSLPFKDPVLVFFLALIIILFTPLLLRKIKVPSIIGLIIAGVCIGPNGFNLLLRDSSIVLFGTVGLLYIMFLAAMELDMEEFKKNRFRSLVFGALVFFIPLISGTVVCHFFLKMDLLSSVFVANMFATFTLVAYPIVSRLGITKNEVVVVAVGGVIVADTSVLLLMSVLLGKSAGSIDLEFILRFIVSLAIFAFIVLWIFPKIGKWFFRNVISDSISQFIFILSMVFASAFLSQLAGVEPIIGAFLAGLSLNRLVPKTSPLMNRIEFVGNALFIPFFLISVGMLVNLKVLFSGREALVIAAAFIIVTLFSKWLAAYIAQKLFGYSVVQRNLLFGLSTAKAAATIAIIILGFNAGIVDENVLNGTILLILVSCLVSSFITDLAGRKLALEEISGKSKITEPPERILVPISNPATIEQLIDFAIMIKRPNSEEPIFPLAVVKDDDEAKEKIIFSKKMLEKAVMHASATDSKAEMISRIDLNVANGILMAASELAISDIVIGWHGKSKTSDHLFGTTLEELLRKSSQMVFVTKIHHPLSTVKRVVVLVPPNAEKEPGFKRWVRKSKRLSKQTGSSLLFFCSKESESITKRLVSELKPRINAEFHLFNQWKNLETLAKKISADDLLLLISSRKGSVSHQSFLNGVPRKIIKMFPEVNVIIVYPQQIKLEIPDSILQFGEFSDVPISQNIERIGRFGRFLKRVFKRL